MKIFLDSGDPKETRETIAALGFLDGQTTNPSLIAKNPETAGKKFAKQELLAFYKGIVQEISSLIPRGSVSVEVYADRTTAAEDMLAQGKEMFSWIPNAHVKYPTTAEGLKAARESIAEGMRVNMTLCFTQEQAAAVYGATKGAKKGDVFVSPFVGRLDDRGENGMDLISNIIKMYKRGAARKSGRASPNEIGRDGHVQVLTASVRNLGHLIRAIQLGSDIVTCPSRILKEWLDKGMPQKEEGEHESKELKPIPYKEINVEQDWESFGISHDLTDKGIEQFAADWNHLLKHS